MSPPIRKAGHGRALQAALSTGVLQVRKFSALYYLQYEGPPNNFVSGA